MAKIHVEKFINGQQDSAFNVPSFVLSLVNWLLPRAAIHRLAQRGISVPAILAAKNNGSPYVSRINVCEHGIPKTVVISVR